MGGWQDISTAPLTSKARLVWCPAYRNMYIVSWIVPLDDRAQPDPDNGFWSHFGGGGRPLNEVPTHWMPLPADPDTTTDDTLAGDGIGEGRQPND